jgi:phage tail sheath protein FI
MRNGAFRSKDPATAFFVDFGTGLNTPAVIFANKLIGRVGLATQKPVDFVILRFSQDTRAFDAG